MVNANASAPDLEAAHLLDAQQSSSEAEDRVPHTHQPLAPNCSGGVCRVPLQSDEPESWSWDCIVAEIK